MHIGHLIRPFTGTPNAQYNPINTNPPFYSRVLAQEFKHFVDSDSAVATQTYEPEHEFHSRQMEKLSTAIIDVDFNIKELQDLALSNGYFDRDLINSMAVDALFRDVTTQIVMLEGQHTFRAALAILEPFIEKLGSNFYGALLRSTRAIINPYHPLTALAMSDDLSTTTYKIVLYIYDNRDRMDSRYYSSIISSDDASKQLVNLVIAAGNTQPVTAVADFQTLYVSSDEENYTVTRAAGLHEHIDVIIANGHGANRPNLNSFVNQQALLIAHQVLANGTIAPYYGTSILFRPNKQSKTKGTALSPCKSANISTSESAFENVLRGSVCTGSTNGITLQSLATLNHANLGSAYNRNLLTYGSLRYFDECVQLSRKTYALAGLLPSTTERTIPLYEPDYATLLTEYTDISTSDTFQEYLSATDTGYTGFSKALTYLAKKAVS